MQIPPNFLRGTVKAQCLSKKGLFSFPETKILRLQLINFGVVIFSYIWDLQQGKCENSKIDRHFLGRTPWGPQMMGRQICDFVSF